jgi:hypothetical protein
MNLQSLINHAAQNASATPSAAPFSKVASAEPARIPASNAVQAAIASAVSSVGATKLASEQPLPSQGLHKVASTLLDNQDNHAVKLAGVMGDMIADRVVQRLEVYEKAASVAAQREAEALAKQAALQGPAYQQAFAAGFSGSEKQAAEFDAAYNATVEAIHAKTAAHYLAGAAAAEALLGG